MDGTVDMSTPSLVIIFGECKTDLVRTNLVSSKGKKKSVITCQFLSEGNSAIFCVLSVLILARPDTRPQY